MKMFEMWTYSLFFCSAELWGAVVISVLAWSLANEVCTVPEAKTVYPLVGIAANIALVVAGNFMKFVNRNLTQERAQTTSATTQPGITFKTCGLCSTWLPVVLHWQGSSVKHHAAPGMCVPGMLPGGGGCSRGTWHGKRRGPKRGLGMFWLYSSGSGPTCMVRAGMGGVA